MAELGRRGPNFKLLEEKFCKQLLSCASVKKKQYFKERRDSKSGWKRNKKIWHTIFKHLNKKVAASAVILGQKC